MGTHLRVLLKSYPMNTNMTGFRCFSKLFTWLAVHWMKVASALGGLVEGAHFIMGTTKID